MMGAQPVIWDRMSIIHRKNYTEIFLRSSRSKSFKIMNGTEMIFNVIVCDRVKAKKKAKKERNRGK